MVFQTQLHPGTLFQCRRPATTHLSTQRFATDLSTIKYSPFPSAYLPGSESFETRLALSALIGCLPCGMCRTAFHTTFYSGYSRSSMDMIERLFHIIPYTTDS